MFRFTVRDLLWLTLVVCLCLGWFVHQRHISYKAEIEIENLEKEVQTLQDTREYAEAGWERAKRYRERLIELESALRHRQP